MRRIATVLAFAAMSACTTVRTGAPAREPLDSVMRRVTTEGPLAGAVWGIEIEDEDRRVVYSSNADKRFAPASNRKLFTALTAADCLGLESTIPTELWIDGEITAGVLHGNVIIKGNGDPSLGGRYYDDRDVLFRPFLEGLRQLGVKAVEGRVIGDGSAYDRDTSPGKWEVEDIESTDGPPVDALAYNENVVGALVDLTECPVAHATTDPAFVPFRSAVSCGDSGSPVFDVDDANELLIAGTAGQPERAGPRTELAPVENPALYAAQALDDFLRRSGIAVFRAPQVNFEPRVWGRRVAVIDSPTLFMLLGTMLADSQNLYAEMLLKDLARGEAPASYTAALAAERLHLEREVGLAPDDFSFFDGSGLAAVNLVTPRAVIRALRYMAAAPRGGVFEMLLARPGEEGTLRRRLLPLAGRLFGKTGSLTGVSALSGWVRRPDGTNRYFSIIVNHDTAGQAVARSAIDQIVLRLAE